MSSEFDLDEWAEHTAEDCRKCTLREKDATVFAAIRGFRKGQEQACKRILKEFHKMMKAEQRQEVYIHLDELNEFIDKILKESK